METIKIDKKVIECLNYLKKHLFDNPAVNPTNVPKIAPNGTKIANIKQISNILGVESKVAAIYVLQDPKAPKELKEEAKEVISPGIFVASEDAFLPVVHKAYNIINNPFFVEEKGVRLVRTVNGVRRFKQKRGSVIVDDGEDPLDALVAMTNDVAGYEKLTDGKGGVYYIGVESGAWVVRDPATGGIIHSSNDEKETYGWLNQHVGGSAPQKGKGKEKDVAKSSGGPGAKTPKGKGEESAPVNPKKSQEETIAINSLDDEELDLYKRLLQRGIPSAQALSVAKRSNPKKK